MKQTRADLLALTCTAARRVCACTSDAPLRFDGTSSTNRRMRRDAGAALLSPSRSLCARHLAADCESQTCNLAHTPGVAERKAMPPT